MQIANITIIKPGLMIQFVHLRLNWETLREN